MIWYVNPKKPEKAIRLDVLLSVETKVNTIRFYTVEGHIFEWYFETSEAASKIYEEIIKLLQEFRYRRSI